MEDRQEGGGSKGIGSPRWEERVGGQKPEVRNKFFLCWWFFFLGQRGGFGERVLGGDLWGARGCWREGGCVVIVDHLMLT